MSDIEPTRLTYPSRTLQSLGRIAGKVDHLVAITDREVVAKAAAPVYTAEDAWDLAQTLADNGTGGLPLHSRIETTSVDTTTPLQRPYGKVYTTIAPSTR
jgi:hypothetical protein